MFNFWLWLLDILGTLEMILRFMFQLIFWLGVIFLLILWLKGSRGYEEELKEIEEFAYREKLKAKDKKRGLNNGVVSSRCSKKRSNGGSGSDNLFFDQEREINK
ncbi:hypothetical protein ES703_121110 [subsurface metagenome]